MALWMGWRLAQHIVQCTGGGKEKDIKDEKDEKDRSTGYSVGKRPGITQKHRVQKKNASSEP